MTAPEAERPIMQDGWFVSGSRGRHRQYTHPAKSGRVTIAFQRGITLDPKTTRSIIEQACLAVEQSAALL
jgi:predicted RNA binding protein YcfA (HicA-like mRNA interferase family)